MVCKQTCKSSHKMISGLRHTFGKVDFVHSSHDVVMWDILHSIADWDCSKILILLSDLEDLKSTWSGVLCIFGRQTFVHTSWMCKKLEFHTVLLNLRLFLQMQVFAWTENPLWDLVIDVLHSSSNQPRARGNLLRDEDCDKHSNKKND